ncbi:MAG: hypothetical protein IJ735_06640 [Clostridia bacterium]|nr:hypothetical protein [Clostridia bacterium]
MSILDKIVIGLSAFLAMTFLCVSLSGNWPFSLILSFLLFILGERVLRLLISRVHAKKKMRTIDLELLFAVMGQNDQLSFFANALPNCFSPEIVDCGILFTVDCERLLLVPCYKFGSVGYEDVTKAYRCSVQSKPEKVLILGKNCTRDILLFAKKLPVVIEFVPSAKVLSYLYRQNKLPDNILNNDSEKKKKTVKSTLLYYKKNGISGFLTSLRTILNDIFLRKRAKWFFLSSVSLAIFSFLTPLKIYYLSMSILCFILATVCLFSRKI